MLRPPERRVSCRMRCLNVASGLAATLRLTSALGHPQLVAQELAPQGAGHRALGLVDLQLAARHTAAAAAPSPARPPARCARRRCSRRRSARSSGPAAPAPCPPRRATRWPAAATAARLAACPRAAPAPPRHPMIPLFRYARISRITPASSMRLPQPVHQDVVVDPVEELLQVHVHHDPPPRLHVRLRGQHRVVRTPPRPEAVAVLAEGGVENRLQHLQQCLLDQPIHHRRDAKLALATVRLRDRHPSHRAGPVRPRQQLLADRGPRRHAAVARSASMSSPSTPAAPLLARTRLNARCRFSLVSAASSSAEPVFLCAHARRGAQASSLAGSPAASPRATPARPACAGI